MRWTVRMSDGVNSALRTRASRAMSRIAGTEAAGPVREARGDHRQGQVGEVDARAALEGLAVQGASGPDVMGDVGDVDAEKPAAVVQAPDADRVVEVLGLFAVDRHGRPVAEIAPVSGDRGGVEVGDLVGFAADVLGEFGPAAVALDDDPGVDAGVVGPAEDPRQGERRPVGLDDHARRGMELGPRLEGDVVDGGRVEGLEIRRAVPLDVDAEETFASLAEDALDAPLGLAELAFLADDDGHLVSRQ